MYELAYCSNCKIEWNIWEQLEENNSTAVIYRGHTCPGCGVSTFSTGAVFIQANLIEQKIRNK